MRLYSPLFYVPLYLQFRGADTIETGTHLLPEPVVAPSALSTQTPSCALLADMVS